MGSEPLEELASFCLRHLRWGELNSYFIGRIQINFEISFTNRLDGFDLVNVQEFMKELSVP